MLPRALRQAFDLRGKRGIFRREREKRVRMNEGTLRIVAQGVDQVPPQPQLQQLDLVEVGHPPSFEFRAARQVQVVQEPAAKQCCGLLQLRQRNGGQIGPHQPAHGSVVKREVVLAQRDRVAVCRERLAGNLSKARQAPAQRAAGIVGDVPEHLAQAFAALRTIGHGEIGQQRARLAGRRKLNRCAAAQHFQIAENVDLQGFAGCRQGSLPIHFGRSTPGARVFLPEPVRLGKRRHALTRHKLQPTRAFDG
jgi:hypothetical protein